MEKVYFWKDNFDVCKEIVAACHLVQYIREPKREQLQVNFRVIRFFISKTDQLLRKKPLLSDTWD